MVVTWIIMAVLTLLAIVFVRNLKVENPGKKQLALEAFISFLDDFFTDILIVIYYRFAAAVRPLVNLFSRKGNRLLQSCQCRRSAASES